MYLVFGVIYYFELCKEENVRIILFYLKNIIKKILLEKLDEILKKLIVKNLECKKI